MKYGFCYKHNYISLNGPVALNKSPSTIFQRSCYRDTISLNGQTHQMVIEDLIGSGQWYITFHEQLPLEESTDSDIQRINLGRPFCICERDQYILTVFPEDRALKACNNVRFPNRLYGSAAKKKITSDRTFSLLMNKSDYRSQQKVVAAFRYKNRVSQFPGHLAGS